MGLPHLSENEGLHAALTRAVGIARGEPGLIRVLLIGLHQRLGGLTESTVESALGAWQPLLAERATLTELGRDRFVAVMVSPAIEQALDLADELRRAVSRPHWASVGLVTWDEQEPAATMLARARQARARAEFSGGRAVSLAVTAPQAASPAGGYLAQAEGPFARLLTARRQPRHQRPA